MKKIKYIVGSLVIVGGLAFSYFNFMGTNANPDYICIKNVNRTCTINDSNCGEWDTTTRRRTCEGTRVTKVAYYHTRTSCEPGYTGIKREGNSSGASGRKSADFVYASERCQIQQTDTNKPSGEVEQIN